MTLLPFLTGSLVGTWMIQNESFIRSFGVKEWVWVCVVCVIACALALAPPTLLALVFGYFLGWKAIVPLILLNLGAIALIYGIVKRMDNAALLAYLQKFPRVTRLLNQVHQHELRFIFFTKLSPVLPFALTNLVFALMGIRFKNIITGGFLGMIPRTVLAVWVGMEAEQISRLIHNPNESVVSRIAILVLVVASVAGMIRVLVKR